MVLVHEAGMYLPYPREEVDLDYAKLGYFMDEDGIEKVNVLLVATKKEVTDLYTEIFEQAELEINVLEINSFALIRTLREQLRQFGSKEAVVLVDLEFDSTEIAIVVEGVPQFSRTVTHRHTSNARCFFSSYKFARNWRLGNTTESRFTRRD